MGTLFSTLDIARSGLQAAQIQMDVAGHNIANVNKEGFSRQRVTLLARSPNYRSFGALGRGVAISNIERVREVFLDTVFRRQAPNEGSALIRASYFTRIEDIFQEPSESGLSTRLNLFFDAANDFANSVEEQPVRLSLVTEAGSLATTLRQVSERIRLLRTNANEEARNLVPQINSLSERIAALNLHIRDSELGHTTANDMRDERDVLVDQLSQIVNITARERPDGQVDILIAGDILVNGALTRELEAVRNPALDPTRSDLVEIQFVDNGRLATIRSGQLFGALSMRDGELVDYSRRIDTMAATIIEQVNRIHSQGNGLVNLSGTIASTNPAIDPVTALSAAGLPFAVTPGTFDVVVYDAAGNASTTTITVTAATTLQSLVADLAAIPNFSATVAADNQTIQLGANAPFTFTFANDTSGALTALGINGLFTGHDAATIAVNADINADPSLLTSGFSLDLRETGDNTAALALANVRNLLVLDGNTATINDHYESTIVRIGVNSRGNQDTLDVESAFVEDFRRRREEISGVSLDEEVTNILQFQRAFEASARVVSTVNSMLDTLINMI